MPKKTRVRTLMESEHFKGSKDCLNLQTSIFLIFFYHSEMKSARKILF